MKTIHSYLFLVTAFTLGLLVSAASAQTATGTVRRETAHTEPALPWVNFRAAVKLSRSQGTESGQPIALAPADFDEDGVPDLVTSYAGAQGGRVSVRRGNIDAIYPNSADAQARRQRGEFTDAAFMAETKNFALPEAADLIGAGDFDADGHWDIVAARTGGDKLFWLSGDGRGNFSKPQVIELHGTVTALVTGEMNRMDGLTDIAVGVVASDGPAVLVFEGPEGALRSAPESFKLSAPASALALGQLDGDLIGGLAIASRNELTIVHGRDRKLSLDEAHRADVKAAQLSRTVLPSAIMSITMGDFAGDSRSEIAVLTADARVRVLEHRSDKSGNGGDNRAFQVSDTMTLDVAENAVSTPSSMRLLAAKVSSLPKDDLVIFGGSNDVRIVTTREADLFDQAGKMTKAGSARMSIAASLPSQSEVTAVLPMRLNGDALKDLVLLNRNSDVPLIMLTQPAAIYVVNIEGNTNDMNPGDGVCLDSDGNCSFSAAIQEANAHSGADTITFNIPGGGVHTVTHNFQLYFNEVVTIDGTTQPDGRIEIATNGDYPIVFYGGNSVVRGVAAYGSFVAIILASNGNIVEDNYVGFRADGTMPVGFGSSVSGVTFRGGVSGSLRGDNNLIGGTTAQARNVISNCALALNLSDSVGNVFQGNYIGTNVAGTAAFSNAIALTSLGGDFTIGGTTSGAGNLISGNGSSATLLVQTSTAIIQGNRIGTTADGTQPIPNSGIGISVSSGGRVVTIGGTTSAARNVIAANPTGIVIYQDGTGSNELVQGNFIGTNAAGTGALPNLSHGIELRGPVNVTIGGVVAGAGNLISGNGGDGISVTGGINGVPTRAVIQGNLIGTDVNGVVAIPNMGNGIQLPSSSGTMIGGTSPAARNVISGNHANGIRLGFGTASSQIKGNYIGLNRFGTGALGNDGAGMFFENFTGLGNTVGGTASGSSNNIAFNRGAGVATANGYPVISSIVANSIHDNVGLGIDLSNNGVTQNTPGSNSNSPIITSAETVNNTTTIHGTLQNGNYTAGITYTLQFFSNANVDPSGYGEGQTYFGQTTIVTDGTTLPHPFSLAVTPAVPPGRFITAVASGRDQFNQEGYEYLSEFSFAARTRGEVTPENTPLLLHLATPNAGGNTGVVTITIIGEGIQQGATVILRRAGQPDIIGTVVFVSADGSSITVRFDLAGHVLGAWDVVVTNPGGTPSTIPGGFTVEPGREPQVWADIIGPTIMRVGSSHLFYITYGNTANIDAPPTEFRMKLPRGLLSIPVLPHSLDGSPAVTIDDGDLITLEFFVRDVPIGSSNAIPVRLIALQAQENFKFELTALTSTELEAAANPPIDPTASASLQVTEDTASSVQMVMNVARATGSLDLPFHLTRSETTVPQEPSITITEDNGILSIKYETTFPQPHLDASSTQDVISIVGQLPGTINSNGTVNPNYVNTVGGLISTANAAGNMTVQNSINDYLFTHNLVDPQSAQGILFQNTATAPVVLNAVSTLAGAPGSPVNAVTAGQLQALTGVMDGAWSLQLWQLYRTDLDVQTRLDELLDQNYAGGLTKDQLVTLLTKKILQTKNIQPTAEPRNARQARDPNDKFGPQGPGAPRFIRGTAPMNYLVLFENQPSATAAAQDVVVTDQLDATKFNLDTFELGPINFGNNVLVTPPPGRKEWNTDIDLRPANNLIVRVIAALETTTGIVTWRFLSLDPITLQPTEDALAGFLPPNHNSPEGEGGVMFKIELRPALADGTEIRNRARIVFDTNAPIDTPEFLNTIDNSPPSSAVQSLPATNSSSHFEVNWAGADAGSGITGYTIYVSVDGGAYTVWLSNTTLTSAFYNGIPGRTYSFYSVALDAAGNLEAPPGPADATTTTPAAGDLFNISTRMRVQTGENVIIGGLIVTGTDRKNVIIRGIGPSLAEFFPGALANPTLELYQGSTLLASNDDWKDTQQAEIEATGIPPTNDLESAIVRTLQPGSYTTVLRGKDDTIGIGVVEAYDLNPAANSKLANISTRGFVETGDDVMIGGCILGGSGSAAANSRVVVRAIGPSLSAFGIAGALQDPTLELKDANGSTLISNDNWQESQAIEINVTGLAPIDFRESAVITYLPDGNYTAIVRGKDNTTGVALVEVYNLQ